MQRKCRSEPLSAQPLILALCQVRLSPIPQMQQHIPRNPRGVPEAGLPDRTRSARSTKSPSPPAAAPRSR